MNNDSFAMSGALPFPRLTTAAIFEPVETPAAFVEWVGLFLGAPTILAGPGFSGKTLFAMSLALGIASGTTAWDLLPCKQGRVLHLDDEQGEIVTRDRYQRLARGHGLAADALADRLHLVVRPTVRLDAKGASETYRRELSGYDLAILDSLRSMAPSLDENKSEFRGVPDTLGEISDSTQCRILLIHHARKPSMNQQGGKRASLRGSGAIFDAAGACFVATAEKDGPIYVSHEKDRVRGNLEQDLSLTIADVARDGDPKWGLRVRASRTLRGEGRSDAADLDRATRIVEHLSANGADTKTNIAHVIGGRKQTVLRTIDRLVDQRVLVAHGRKFAVATVTNTKERDDEHP